MNGLNYMPADSTRAAIKNRGLRHHPDGSSSKNYSVSEVRTGDLFKFKNDRNQTSSRVPSQVR
jgi:hypothetical protein